MDPRGQILAGLVDTAQARGGGGQFDPAVVDACSQLGVDRPWPPEPQPQQPTSGPAAVRN
jgi:hypothetical protein